MAEAHFNGLTPSEAELLALLMEECGEVIQVIGKIMRHGLESWHPADDALTSNRTLLELEMGHVLAAYELLSAGVVRPAVVQSSRARKRVTIRKWLHHAEGKV
jgi:hypothetical protein